MNSPFTDLYRVDVASHFIRVFGSFLRENNFKIQNPNCF